MANELSFPANWGNILSKPAGVRPILETIIDPDNQHIKIGGMHDITKIQAIAHEINPDINSLFNISLRDLAITFNDPDEFFSPGSLRDVFRPFRRVSRVLNETTDSNPVQLRDGILDFKSGDTVIFTDGTYRDVTTVTTATSNSITFSGTLSHTYQPGDFVATIPVTGMDVLIQMYLYGQPATLELFKGIVRKPFDWDGTSATLSLDNKIGKVLSQELRIVNTSDSPIKRVNTSGSLVTSITWNSSSAGTLSNVIVYEGAQLGKWTITFSDSQNFVVDGPNCVQKAGDVNTDFYDQTAAFNSQIKIPSSYWGGIIVSGDTVTFYVSANFASKTPPEIVYEILHDYGGTSDDDIDVGGTGVIDTTQTSYSFNKAYSVDTSNTISVSFDKAVTVGDAISSVLPHGIGALTQSVTGKYRYVMIHPDFEMATVTPYIIGEPKFDTTDIVNQVTVFYAWDYSKSSDNFQYSYTHPIKDDENKSYLLHGKKVAIENYAPGI